MRKKDERNFFERRIYEKNIENQGNCFHFTNFKNESFIDKIQKKNKNTRSRAFLEKYLLE